MAASRVHGYDLSLPAGAKAGQFTGFKPCQFTGLASRGTDQAECGTLVVAESRARPKGRLLALPVVKLPALKPTTLTPLFFFQGGPGATNLQYGVEAPTVFQEHDIYMLGYRGVDDLQPLECPEVGIAVVGPHPLGGEIRGRITAASKACAQRLAAAGIDVRAYGMVDVVADYEDLRTALGIKTVSLIGASYGTRIEQYYARLHPSIVSRSVQFGVNPPGHFRWFPKTNDAIVAAYARLCAADAWCSQQTPDLVRTTMSVLSRTDFDADGQKVDMDRVRIAAFFQLMNKPSSIQLFRALIAAEKGDTRALVGMARSYDGIMPHAFVWGEATGKAGADCDPADGSFAPARMPTAASFGSPLDLVLFAACQGWPVQPPPPGFAVAGRDATETLLVNGDLDASTPLRYVQGELMPHLPRGHLFILKGQGHDGWRNEQPPAFDRLVATFLRTGAMDDTLYRPATVSFGGPATR
ncbi:MAG TPA: alpha/beta fold hydrolase [Phenylobacterium sp.]|nr:alpha/beta fold hydrolase [Phenylobacterium sp.]